MRRGEPGPAQACSRPGDADRGGFRFLLAEAAIHRGWALVQQGSIEPGLAELAQGLEAHRATGTRGGLPAHLALLAEAYGRAGRPADGLGVVAGALAMIDATGERSFEAELHRLEGELRAQTRCARDRSRDETRPATASSARSTWPAARERGPWSWGRS